MNIIEAREAAMAGKTVITPNGVELVHYGFGDMEMISREWVFGEWEIKQEPVVFEATVSTSRVDDEHGEIDFHGEVLMNIIGKRVKVTVEVLEGKVGK